MYLLPYKLEKISLNPPVWRLWVFMTAGGKQVWETDAEDSEKPVDTLVQEYCIENELLGSVKKSNDEVILYELETLGSSFYTWNDFLVKNQSPTTDSEVWRPFFWIGEMPGKEDEYEWLTACQKISLGKFGTLDKLWLVLRELTIEY